MTCAARSVAWNSGAVRIVGSFARRSAVNVGAIGTVASPPWQSVQRSAKRSCGFVIPTWHAMHVPALAANGFTVP